MPGSLTRGAGETFLTFPAQTQVAFLRTWQEAHTAARTSPWQVVPYIFNEGEGEKAYIHILIRWAIRLRNCLNDSSLIFDIATWCGMCVFKVF